MSEQYWFWTSGGKPPKQDSGPGLRLRLQQFVEGAHESSASTRKPVLLLHGASACHRSFTVPEVGLAQVLLEKGFDPWVLDWRGSHLVVDENKDFLEKHPDLFNFNRAAMEDLPSAIREMRERNVKEKISLLGHCMGSTVIAEAVAMEHVTPKDVDCIVLSTLGLFYEAPIDSRLKSEERILERLSQPTARSRPLSAIDPRVASDGSAKLEVDWPLELNRLYDAWPRTLRSHDEPAKTKDPKASAAFSDTDRRIRNISALCNRLSFMYGIPYHHRRLVDAIHGTDLLPPQLQEQFGAIPLAMYLNAARNLRAGHALIVDKELLKHHTATEMISDDARARFRALKVTLVTGALNRLWHRDSIDRMHEWLCRGSSCGLGNIRKHVFPDFAHQDLWWATDSPEKIYPSVIEALTEGYDLRLMSVDSADDLLNEGRNLVIVALVGTDLHIRIFDANGKRVVDKAESELISGETLTALKKQLNPLPDESRLSREQKQKFIRDATSIAGHTLTESP